jgi:hypothetical protein
VIDQRLDESRLVEVQELVALGRRNPDADDESRSIGRASRSQGAIDAETIAEAATDQSIIAIASYSIKHSPRSG